MNRSQKKELLNQLHDEFKSAEIVILAHQNGLTVSNTNQLRTKLYAIGAKFKVTKNNIAELAVKGTDYEGLASMFVGPIVMAWSADPIQTAKIIHTYAKENEKLVIVGGAIRKTILDKQGVVTWATMPTMDEIRGKLVGLIQAPAAQLARLASAYGTKTN